MDVLVAVQMGGCEAEVVETGQLGIELTGHVGRVDSSAERPSEEFAAKVEMAIVVDQGGDVGQRASFGEVEVQPDPQIRVVGRRFDRFLGSRCVDHQRGGRDLPIPVGGEDPASHVTYQGEVVGVHDDLPAHVESMAWGVQVRGSHGVGGSRV